MTVITRIAPARCTSSAITPLIAAAATIGLGLVPSGALAAGVDQASDLPAALAGLVDQPWARGLDRVEARDHARAALAGGRFGVDQRLIRQVQRLAADQAQATCQALSRDQDHAGGDVERRDAHVAHARERGWGIIGVQRGQYQVASERGLDGDLCGLEVANLAHHDDIRVLPEKCPKTIYECHPCHWVDLSLVGARNMVFNWIFDARNVYFRTI